MLLDHKAYFVKERVAVLKLTDTFDIFDPQTQKQIGIAKEEPEPWAKWLRLVIDKRFLPTVVNIYESEQQPPVISMHRPFTFLRAKVTVSGRDGKSYGYFKSKLLSIGAGFWVHDTQDRQVAEVKGDWKSWNFKLLGEGGREIGTVSRKWGGIGKELFTSADNYMIALNDSTQPDVAALMLAAGIAIDIVFKER